MQIDRILRLYQENDRCFLIERLKLDKGLPFSCEEIEAAILFLSDKLDREWLTVYPSGSGSVSIRTGPKMSNGLSFFSVVVPLGLALIELREMKEFGRLIQKLSIQSNERLSSILEALSAARYKKAGYEVELEPSTESGRFSDFRVKFEGESIYFECKKEYYRESKYYKRSSEYVNNITERILKRAESKLLPTCRIDILLSKRIQENELNHVIDRICECIDAHEYNQWQETDGIRFAVNSRETKVKLPSLGVRQYRMKVGTTPTKMGEENAHIQVIYDPFGSKELQKVRRIIKEANEQLPRKSRGIIILETEHTKRMVGIAQEKLVEPRYEQVIAILVTGNGAWSVPNTRHQGFPLDFLKIAFLPKPQPQNLKKPLKIALNPQNKKKTPQQNCSENT